LGQKTTLRFNIAEFKKGHAGICRKGDTRNRIADKDTVAQGQAEFFLLQNPKAKNYRPRDSCDKAISIDESSLLTRAMSFFPFPSKSATVRLQLALPQGPKTGSSL
jgi:hypothetical protein